MAPRKIGLARAPRTDRPSIPEPRSGRFVNASLWSDRGDAQPRRIAQQGARLVAGRTYHLGVRIGPHDRTLRTLGAAAVLEERLKWRDGEAGTWAEVGVTGIGFEVLGEPVQEVWIPRDTRQRSDLLRFAVVPRGRGVSTLRFCLYHRQNVVQSFRVAAVTVESDDAPVPRSAAHRLARALDVTPAEVGDAGWLPRLEYSLVSGQGEVAAIPPRALSIVANDLDDEMVVTVKGRGAHQVVLPGDVGILVRDVRARLDAIATRTEADGEKNYAFGRDDPVHAPNVGDEASLREALMQLAKEGWYLCSQVIPDVDALRSDLSEPDRLIHVAHVVAEKVFPWSLIYDRPFTPGEQVDEQGNELGRDACLAALPRPDGTLPVTRCRESEACLLHRAACERRRQEGGLQLEEYTVACPLHFWGFVHQVEIPPQQVKRKGDAKSILRHVEAGRPARLVAGFNEALPLAETHRKSLKDLETELAGDAEWSESEKEFAGQLVTHRLDDSALDLAYLYCHARGSVKDASLGKPRLEFVGLRKQTREIDAGDLKKGKPWEHNPLIVLNGCGTVGFNPDALSPFLPVLRSRGAAGLLGTEVSVWEQLAGEFALHFLRAFLKDKRTAGQALLEARRRLLAQMNPLGLVYTLYADAELAIAARLAP